MCKTSLKILEINVHSITSLQKRSELNLLIQKILPDIIVLCETYLKPKHKFSIKNYITYRSDRVDRVGGGTAILIRDNISHSTINTPKLNSSIETTIIKINLFNQEIICVGAYNPNDLSSSDLKKLLNLGSNVIIVGDLNAKSVHWNCLDDNNNGKILRKFQLDNFDLINLAFPDSPTYIPICPNYNSSILDIAICKNVNIPFKPYTLDSFDSDHVPVIFNILFKNRVQLANNIPKLNFSKTNWQNFRDRIDEILEFNVQINCIEDIDFYLNNLINSIKFAIEQSVPTCKNTASKDNLPDIIQKMINEKSKLRRLWRKNKLRNNTNINLPLIKSKINLLTNLIREQLIIHENSIIERKLGKIKENSNDLYKTIKNFTKTKQELPAFKIDGISINNNLDKANLLADHFEKSHVLIRNDNNIFHEDHVSNIVNDYINNIINQPIEIFSTNPSELLSIIKNLKTNKAPGIDQIPNIVLKNLSKKSLILLTKIINGILKYSYFPNIWKIAKIIPVHKIGKSPFNNTSYRPISLLSALSKIVEKIILIRLNKFNLSNNIIPNEQFGFRQDCSTTDGLLRLNEFIVRSFNDKRSVVGVALDIEKAFDSVWTDGLIYKLINLQFPSYLIRIIYNYLKNRTFYVQVNDSCSSVRNICAGVPQGSLLGPVLYTVFMYDLPHSPDTELSVYADDTFIYSSSIYIKNASVNIQLHLNSLSMYYDKWKINVNASKTEAIVFTKKRRLRRLNKPIILKYKDNIINYSSSIKYLGITMNKNLSYNSHIDNLKNKALNCFSSLYPLLKINSGLNIKNKIKIYTSLIRPNLIYGSPIWLATISKSHLAKLLITERKVLRLAINFIRSPPLYHFISNEKLYEKSDIPNLNNFLHDISSRYLQCTFDSRNDIVNSLGQFDDEYYNINPYKPSHYLLNHNYNDCII